MVAKFGVLGPLQIISPDGRWLRLRGERQRTLLAMLLFHANRPVPTERLVDALWPDVPPKSYASNLHTYVSRLRERLGPARIDHAGQGYRLWLAGAECDLLVFRVEANRGREALRAGDSVQASGHLRAALAQWRGHPLGDLTVPALEAEVARLETERLTVFEDCVTAELAAGRHAELVGELQAAVAEHPLRERLVGLLMTALARAGRQVDALTLYRDTRATLIDETGLEPGAELRDVHATILRGESQAPAWPNRQLPADLPDFSGREELTGELARLLSDGRVVVLSGEPGAGKTTVAVRVAHRLAHTFPDGQLFASLAGATTPRAPGDVLTDLLKTLGVTGPAIPDHVPAKAAVLRGLLADRRVLLVLDDAADPAQVRHLLPGTRHSAVLITSRRRLSGLDGAHRVAVGSFTDAEAVELLGRIAGDRIAGEPAGAARIAAACGNLPLALRIAGTRLALRPERLDALADRLVDERRRLDELSISDLRVRSGLALSYTALSEPAKAMFRLVGIVDLANLPTWAFSVLLDGADPARVLDELVESSLLRPLGPDACGEPRYQMHDLVLAYARELALEKDGYAERELASVRLVDAGLSLIIHLGGRLPSAFPPIDLGEPVPATRLPGETLRRLLAEPTAWFAAERRTLVTGLDVMSRTGWHRQAARMLERFARYLWPHGFYADLRTCAERLAAGARAAGDDRVETWAEAVLARILQVRGSYTDAVEKYRWCAARLTDQQTRAWVLAYLAECLTGLGRPEEALRLTEGATHADLIRAKSTALNRLGRAEEAVRVGNGAVAAARRTAEPRQVAHALQTLSWSLALTGNLDGAADAAQESVSLLRPAAARSPLARSLRTMGAIHAGRGERTLALRAFAEGRGIAAEIGEAPRVLSCTRALAAGWVGGGRVADAITELRSCLAAYREMGSMSSVAVTLWLLASAYSANGDERAASRARAAAERVAEPRDANVSTLTGLLLNLTKPDRVPGSP